MWHHPCGGRKTKGVATMHVHSIHAQVLGKGSIHAQVLGKGSIHAQVLGKGSIHAQVLHTCSGTR